MIRTSVLQSATASGAQPLALAPAGILSQACVGWSACLCASANATDRTGDEVSLLLSSDVLFDIGQSALRPDAQDTLGAAVAQIDAAGATSVTVAGHTDNTGTDAINGPLSQARATAVEAEPAHLVRPGVTFQTAGHGSTAPVASNETEEGSSATGG